MVEMSQAPAGLGLVQNRSQSAGRSHFQRSLRAFSSQRSNWISVAILAAGLIMAITPVSWLPHNPTAVNPALRLEPPSLFSGEGDYWLGTDTLGRDMLSRSIYAARWTFLVSFSAVLISTLLGSIAGIAAGFLGGWTDTVLSRLIDIQLAFPIVLLAIAVLAVAGPSLVNMILVLGVVDWARFGRVIRGNALSVRQNDYIEAAKAVGSKDRRIMAQHVLPNVLSSIIVLTTFSAARLMLTESALSFLGLGVTPPATTWGGMIGSGRDYILDAWWISAVPGLLITATVLAINMLGDGLRDAFDPQNHR